MLDKLGALRTRYDEIGEQMTDPDVISDMKRFVQLNKDYKELQPIVVAYEEYKNIVENIESSKEIIKTESDEDFLAMAKEELSELNSRKEELEEEIRVLLIPKDPTDEKNAILEIRAGAGGDEASIFAGDLFRMYQKYCDTKGWKFETVDVTEGTVGGFKEIIINVSGKDVYGTLKYESGVHRVQRIPQTETQGRVHTSAATVAILPEAEEFDIDLKKEDIKRDEYCSSGPGGQSVNTTYSAIRLTHIPTGIVVTCQDQKSKLKNLDKAMAVLRSRIYEREHQKYMDEISAQRKTMVSTGDRSAKIRTYNYPQGRVTDHRIGLTLYNLSNIVDGDIQEIIDKLQMAENAERLKEQENSL
ncbi:MULTISPECIES: peptide chain release factor 1 [unclassified Lentimicrobium]|uniref:peptide chain release factor 1 n=1 Tax=unclassified Lentimicrobium TaxID=2677434 RepID=UPI001553FC44|nr:MULTISPECIES: peptide chain release factor 1 [unclassified Lentimicrobium]NPD46813.1 peptide chain release factor 1 [Lentimicrobium sp. S6]NPD85616.1 peptide chain release factor 1 [Lentimicrobium sp. L6]